jgi:hypothetical protein
VADPPNADPGPRWTVPGFWRPGAVVIGVAVVMTSLFALSFGVVLGRAAPHDVPVAVIAPGGPAQAVAAELDRRSHGGLDLRGYPSFEAARADVDRQRIFAVLSDAPDGVHLALSSASGGSVSRILLTLAGDLPAAQRPVISDLHPLPAGDPQGLSTFYLVLAATIGGFVCVFQLRANTSGVPLRGWFGLLLVLAVAVGGGLAVMATLLLRFYEGPFAELWVLLAAECFIAAAVNSVMVLLVGRWAIVPTWIVFVLLGSAASGGAVAPPLLPAAYRVLNQVLPTGATVSAVHGAAYFPGFQDPAHFLVLAGWAVAATLALLLLGRRQHRSPAD